MNNALLPLLFLQTKALKCSTVPKPFNLSTGKKKEAEGPGVYVPMAQQIQQFQNRTPDRYHLRSRKSINKGVCVWSQTGCKGVCSVQRGWKGHLLTSRVLQDPRG